MKNSKFSYYLSNALSLLIPSFIYRIQAKRLLRKLSDHERQKLSHRVDYYNQLSTSFSPDSNSEDCSFSHIKTFKKTKGWTYYFDTKSVIKYFNPDLNFNYINGDVRRIPHTPSFVKSRPISSDNQNSILLKLNKIRHFQFVEDTIPYQNKKDMVVWRGVGYKAHRKKVLHAFYNHPQCNIGQTKPKNGDPWEKEFLSLEEQLQYKFLLAIEGNDVATNLKWAMSSNSLVIMSKPKYETWFMEGKLEAGFHYVEVKEDYSDLIEKMEYYLHHEDEALAIIKNANKWVEPFKDLKQEHLLSLLVADKYFKLQS